MSAQTVNNSAVNKPPLRHISNSEVSTWLNCERKYYYNFDLNLAPIKWGTSLSRGLAGHEVLAVYYEARRLGASHTEAKTLADNKLAELIRSQNYSLEILADIDRILTRYWTFCEKDNWEILAVEHKHSVDLTDEFDYTFRLDVLARINGELTVVDHKFVYDFYQAYTLDFMPQLPKYIATLNAGGLHIKRGMLNMLRWRTKKDGMTDEDMFRRSILVPNKDVLRNHMREQILASRRIVQHRALSMEERERTVQRNMSKMNCQNCSYSRLCVAQLNGSPIDIEIQTNYQPNDYDYNSGSENE